MNNQLTEVYLGLGGNIGNTYGILNQALSKIKAHGEIHQLMISRFYKTTPVSGILQNDFINAACKFKTSLTPWALLNFLQQIESSLGKIPKPKDAPRAIDCDILFYGHESVNSPELEIPHPRWKERLFVLVPLADLIEEIMIPGLTSPLNLKNELLHFHNINQEKIIPLMEARK